MILRMRWLTVLIVCAATVLCTAGASAQSRGARLAEQWCAQCHAIRPGQTSPNPKAPPFARVAADPSITEYTLRIFLKTQHPTMPNFIIKPDDIDDLSDYILALKPKR